MRTIFRGGRVFDGSGAPTAGADVVIEGGRIVEVGRGLDGDVAVDASGKTLLPGMFDCHTHVALDGVDLWKILQLPFSYRFFQAARNLERTLAAGITTVRDAGGADLGVKQAVDDGLVSGPRMQISITMICQTGGHGDGWMPSGLTYNIFPRHPGSPSGIVDGPEEMRRKVRELVRNGADVIKVATTGGVMSPRDRPQHAHFRPDELRALVAEATAAGVFVMSHAQGTDGIKNAVRAGIRSIEHGMFLDDEAIELMIERGAYLVPTLMAPMGVIAAAESGVDMLPAVVAKARETVDAHRDSVTRAIGAGVKIAMGTDSGVTPHGDNLQELGLMAECGMAPEQVMVATTRSSAELMGLGEEIGTLEPGKRADVVVVEGDPFDFKTLPQRIEAVYKDGVLALS
jgi:imidazolonepropionase-like amidohydrolase